ncbi:nucleoside deaminase [Candidatus Dependentiae bacterium]|nr:nucleoside deaminase [Candidatus Dependentiae bacterium]
MPASHNSFMQCAIELSMQNVLEGGGPFGAVVVKNGIIIAEGVNRVTRDNDPTAHAEIVVIRHACNQVGSFQLTGCTVYSSCEPCPMCLGALYWARVDTVYFANTKQDAAAIDFDDSFIYTQISLPTHTRSIPFIHLDVPQARKAFVLWKNKIDKICY